jgi:hypothetical protein
MHCTIAVEHLHYPAGQALQFFDADTLKLKTGAIPVALEDL